MRALGINLELLFEAYHGDMEKVIGRMSRVRGTSWHEINLSAWKGHRMCGRVPVGGHSYVGVICM